jgi:hypothetical protein
VRIPAETHGDERLATMLGIESNGDLAAALAAGMDCRASEVRTALRNRGEADLADVIPATADARLETEIASLIAELE